MKIIDGQIPGLLILEPDVFADSRGYFTETWNRSVLAEAGLQWNFVQDNESFSRRGVLRGLHFQRAPYAQAKLVRCAAGRILDVALDIRPESPTFGKHAAVELTSDNHRQFFIPAGFAHGFIVLSDSALVAYKCDRHRVAEAEAGINAADPALEIDWRLPEAQWIRSPRDCALPSFQELLKTP